MKAVLDFRYVAVTASKGTIHNFSPKENQKGQQSGVGPVEKHLVMSKTGVG